MRKQQRKSKTREKKLFTPPQQHSIMADITHHRKWVNGNCNNTCVVEVTSRWHQNGEQENKERMGSKV